MYIYAEKMISCRAVIGIKIIFRILLDSRFFWNSTFSLSFFFFSNFLRTGPTVFSRFVT